MARGCFHKLALVQIFATFLCDQGGMGTSMILSISTGIVHTISPAEIAGPFTLVEVLVLLGLLTIKELLVVSEKPVSQRFNRILNLAIAPLLLAFLMVMLVKVFQSLF